MAGKKRGARRVRGTRSAQPMRGLVRRVARIESRLPYKSRVSNDPRPLSSGVILSKTIEFIIAIGTKRESQYGDVGQPGLLTQAWTANNAFEITLSWKDLTLGMIAQCFKTNQVAPTIAVQAFALTKMSIWGPVGTSSANRVELSVSLSGDKLPFTVRDEGTHTRRACASITVPQLEWVPDGNADTIARLVIGRGFPPATAGEVGLLRATVMLSTQSA